MTKEEILMQAIGMLPEEMTVQESTEELKKDARKLERKETLYKNSFILANAAACLVLIIIISSINKNYNTGDTMHDTSVNVVMPDKNSNSQSYSNESSVNCFVIGIYKENSIIEDINHSLPQTDLKKALQGSTVKLQTVKDIQTKSSAKKKAETEYIVFSFDEDCYFNVPGMAETGETYILDKENNKKHYIKEKEKLCKAGNFVYFDVSGTKVLKDTDKESIKEWDIKGIEVITSIDIYQKEGGIKKKAGIFYIGVKQKKKNNKERNIYYGRFENEN